MTVTLLTNRSTIYITTVNLKQSVSKLDYNKLLGAVSLTTTGFWWPVATVEAVARGIPTATTWLPLTVSDGLTAEADSALLRVLLMLLEPTAAGHRTAVIACWTMWYKQKKNISGQCWHVVWPSAQSCKTSPRPSRVEIDTPTLGNARPNFSFSARFWFQANSGRITIS